MDKIVTGIIAHVDAGKTTLSETLMYRSGRIRKMGRVDDKDAYLDTDHLEKERGITIFSKQAVFSLETKEVMLLDTPGHIDFSAEMERTLQVLDYAILVISGADGVQGHTRTIWNLLEKYSVPAFIFVNKMDQNGTDRQKLLGEINRELSDSCIDFSTDKEAIWDSAATCSEQLLEKYLEDGYIEEEQLLQEISKRNIYPVYFGSALKDVGVDALMQGLEKYTKAPEHTAEFGARVFKISRDEQGNRLTHMKITGGSLKVKSILMEEKVNQIRMYSGVRFEAINEAETGCVCAVTGLTQTYPGQCFGVEEGSISPILEPVLTYRMILPDGCDAALMLPKLRQLQEEDPQLHIVWNEELQEIQVQIMGEVQTEIIKSLVKERFNVDVSFGKGKILYRETICDVVEGVGHFEPLRHYAEVHLLLEPMPRGSGIIIETDCSEDQLDKNWQRLIVTHLAEKEHRGVLTGAPVTDIKFKLAAGRAHLKHTEGGDFRQATYRAVRHGLMHAQSKLLEPYYNFRLEVPQQMVGRAMTDLEQMFCSFEMPQNREDMAILVGRGPVATLGSYQMEVVTYTRGMGRISLEPAGYDVCHNEEEVLAENIYDAERDIVNTADSVFCAHGAGFAVPWWEVEKYMHLPSVLAPVKNEDTVAKVPVQRVYEEKWIDTDEVDRILNMATNANKKENVGQRKYTKKKAREDYFDPAVVRAARNMPKYDANKKEYLLVDGYNIIFAWKELDELAKDNIDGARGKLMDILSEYQGLRHCEIILVFDAYRVEGHKTEVIEYHNIHVVYTKEAETADQYIEKFAHENGKKYRVTVATSDGLEQIIIRGQGCALLSARELEEAIENSREALRENYLEQEQGKVGLLDGVDLNKLKDALTE